MYARQESPNYIIIYDAVVTMVIGLVNTIYPQSRGSNVFPYDNIIIHTREIHILPIDMFNLTILPRYVHYLTPSKCVLFTVSDGKLKNLLNAVLAKRTLSCA